MVSAERKSATDAENQTPALLSEFRTGTWSRSFRFLHSLNREELTANFRDGILEITAGKSVSHTSVTIQLED